MSGVLCNVTQFCVRRHVDAGRGDDIAIITRHGAYTYNDLLRLLSKVGNGLKALGVKSGDRVIIALPDGLEFAAALFGTMAIGAIAVMVDPASLGIEAIAVRVRAKIVIDETAANDACVAFPDLVRDQLDILAIFPNRENDDALWLFSGGTTGGRQKIVRQRHGSYVAVCEYLARDFMGYDENDRTLSVPRLFFGYATGGNLFFPLSVGGKAILIAEKPTPEGIFAQVNMFRPTIVINTPAMIKKMIDWVHVNGVVDLSSVRMMTSAGEKLPVSIYEAWTELFPQVPLCDGLGFAEHWYFVSFNLPWDTVPGTVGRIIPGLEVTICNENGGEVPRGEVGALWVRGPALAKGYFDDTEATAASFRHGWFVGGDMAKLEAHPDGERLVYLGREGNSFKVSGQWVFAAEIEDCILRCPDILECAVVAYEDDNGLDKPAAFIVTAKPLVVTSVANYVLSKIAKHKCPQRFFFQEHPLPRTPLGKVDLAILRARLKVP